MFLTIEEKLLIETIFEEERERIQKFIGDQRYWYHDGDINKCIFSTNQNDRTYWDTKFISLAYYYNNIENKFEISKLSRNEEHLKINIPFDLIDSKYNLKYFDICLIFFKVFNIKPWDTRHESRLRSHISLLSRGV